MNPFEEFLRRLFGSGPPPTVIEEERQAKNLGKTAENMPKMARDLGKSFVEAYKQRAQDLQTLATQQVRGQLPLSDYGQMQSPSQAQRDLALDVLSAGGGAGMRVGADLLSSAPAVGGSVARNALPKWLQSSAEYAAEKEALKQQLLMDLIRRPHPLEDDTPMRKIYHSSRGVFEAPTLDPTRQGAGVGDFWQGTGAAYVAESPQVRDFYRELLSRSSREITLPSGKKVKDPSNKIDEVVKKIENNLYSAEKKLYNDYSDENIKEVADLREQLSGAISRRVAWKPFNSTTSNPSLDKKLTAEAIDAEKARYADLYRRLRKFPEDRETKLELKAVGERLANFQNFLLTGNIGYRPKDPFVTSYSGYFYANPDELFNLNLPITVQPSSERIIAGLNELPVGSGDRGFILPGERLGDAMIRQQRTNMAEPNLTSTNANEMIVSGQRQSGSNWSAVRPEFTSATPWQVMEALKDKGIVGNQYLDRRSFEALPTPQGMVNPTYNYVVTDPSRLRFTDLFGAANPFAPLGTTMQTIRNEQEKKNATKKPSKKS